MSRLTVLLATFRRSSILEQSLSAMSRMDTEGLDWELLIVDNAVEQATLKVCESFAHRLPLRYLVCTTPGKCAALNHGLAEVTGDLVVLTDDDVLPDRCWLQEMARGARQWPDHVLFGGRVLPHWPAEPPKYLRNPNWDRWTYSVHDPAVPEGPCTEPLPIGPNMAIRRRIFEAGLRYDESVGPNGKSFAQCDEVAFMMQLTRRGEQPVFLPRALVYHIIRPEQLDKDWLCHRAFNEGRGRAALRNDFSWLNTARLAKYATSWGAAYYSAWLRGGKEAAFPKRMSYSLARGSLYEALRRKLKGIWLHQ